MHCELPRVSALNNTRDVRAFCDVPDHATPECIMSTRRLILPAGLSLLLLLGLPIAAATELYVAPTGNDAHPGTRAQPLATIRGARDAIRRQKSRGPLAEPIRVHLRGGTYRVSTPIEFGPEDSGTAEFPITVSSAEGELAVIDGGCPIDGWRQHGDRLWVADVPDVNGRPWRFRQLYVGGEKAVRARIPNQGYFRVAACPEGTPKTVHYHTDCKSFEFKPGEIRPDWTNLQDVEVVVYHFWTDSHLPIQSVDTKTNLVTFQHKAGKVFTDDFTEDGARYIVENVFEGLDSPGEWYLNQATRKVYYYPRPGENLAAVQVIAPVAPALIRFEGDAAAGKFVEHLAFEDLAFTHTHFDLPPGNSNDRQGSASVAAAITMQATRGCRFANCRLSDLGTFAFDILAGCAGNEFVGNEIGKLAAGGFRIDGGTQQDPPWQRSHHNTIRDNWLHHYGIDYPSAVGILLMHTEGNVVAHNEIEHGGYTGVSVGWVWGYGRSISQHNRIEFNHIHDIGGVLSDMGGIYTLGVSPGTVIRNNHIHHVTANHYGGWGIYHDEGSTHLLVENNVVHHTKFAPFNIHYAKELTVRNNIFALGALEQLSRGRSEPHESVYFENNLVYWREGELFTKNWKDTPYRFHFHPKNDGGTRQVSSTSEFDWNLYFNPDRSRDQVQWDGGSWEEWQARGKDRHSRYADPLFVDPEQGDFSLQPESPALALGFQPIDLGPVGPRGQPGVQR